MAETIDTFETTAGQDVSKRIDSIGRVYYVADGEGRISAKAYAGKARHKAEPETPDVPVFPPEPDDFELDNKMDEITGDAFKVYDDWKLDDGGVPIAIYPEDERVQQLRSLMRKHDEYELYSWSVRYKVVRDGKEEPEFSRLRTPMQAFAPGSLEDDFRSLVSRLRDLAANYSNVHVYSTHMVGRVQA